MEKIRIKLVKLGFIPHKIDLNKIKSHKSALFEIVGDIDYLQLKNTKNKDDYSTYNDAQLEDDLPKASEKEDFLLAFSNCGLDDDFYARILNTRRVILSFRNIYKYLSEKNIPLENMMLKTIYKYALFFNEKTKTFDMSMEHDETRGCIFDMNRIIEDVVLSCENPSICDNCKKILKESGMPINILNAVEKELKKIKKPLFYRMFDLVKAHPILSIFVSSIYAVLLGVLSSYIFNYL